MATELELRIPARANLAGLPSALVRAMRPRQWTKNALVLAAPIFALRFDARAIVLGLSAVAVFCAVSAATYLFNDVVDAPADRRHPTKCRRPIASGELPIPVAVSAAVMLLAGALLGAYLIAPLFTLAVVVYLLVQLAYNVGLKNEPIVDIMCIAAGFVTRAVGGGVAVGVPISDWFVLCVALLAFYLGIEKRKAELRRIDTSGPTRAVLSVYSMPLLLRMEAVATGSVLISYGLWAIQRGRSPWMLATIAFVAFGLFRYQLLSDQGEGEAPEKALLRSPHLIVAVVLWVVTCVSILLLEQRPGVSL